MRFFITFVQIFVFSVELFSQEYFQKIYKLDDSTSFFQDIYLKDSSIYLGATVGYPGVKFQATLVKLDQKGDVLQVSKNTNPPNNQMACFVKSDLDTNYTGNLIFAFTEEIQSGANSGFPRIIEFDFNGEIKHDTILKKFYDNDSFLIGNNSSFLINKSDSTFFFSISYINLLTSNSELLYPGDPGVLLLKLSKQHDIIWVRDFVSQLPPQSKTAMSNVSLTKTEGNNILLNVIEVMFNGPANAELDWSKSHFYKIDSDGQTIEHKTFQDTQMDMPGFSMLQLNDGSKIINYFDSKIVGVAPNGDEFAHRPLIARIDSNMNIIWKDTLNSFFGYWNDFGAPNKILKIDDTTIVYGFKYFYKFGPTSNIVLNRIENRNINGQLNWYRDFKYYPTDNWNDPQYQIMDVEKGENGDLYFAGQVLNTDLLNQNLSGQNAYLLKTNCLGFMESPISDFSYTLTANNEVEFYNLSSNSGSFLWGFGDGTFLNVRENQNVITHHYDVDSIYNVKLTSFGCNGIFDTITINLDLNKTDSIVNPNINPNPFQINPNPISIGQPISVNIGSISPKLHTLIIYNELGQEIKSYIVPKSNVFLTLNPLMSSGIYFFTMFEEDRKIFTRKIVVY